MKKNIFCYFAVVLISCLILPKLSYGFEFRLSVTPYEGGYDLRYGKITPALGKVSKEIIVNINSAIGKQYRLVQVFNEPLMNFQGSTIPQNCFVVYGLNGTNKFGTINVLQETPLSSARQILYTSNQPGSSDSFTLVYNLTIPDNIQAGTYRGRINFILEPIDFSQSSITATINILADVEIESAIQISTETGSKSIILRPDKQEANSANVIFNIKGDFGRQFRIIQVVGEQPTSSEGNFLNFDAIKFIGSASQKGSLVNQLTALSGNQQVIYTSSDRGEADNFVVQYSLGDLSKEKAGRFRTLLKYYLEKPGQGQVKPIDTLGLEIENPSFFELSITPQSQSGRIEFTNLKPDELPRTSEMIIEVKTNKNKRYQVSQNVYSKLTNKNGDTIPEKYFSLRTESLDTKGKLGFLEKQAVKIGDTVLFISDSNGSPDKFKAVYELISAKEIVMGDYSTRITYSLLEI
jgi:hypothetical protein